MKLTLWLTGSTLAPDVRYVVVEQHGEFANGSIAARTMGQCLLMGHFASPEIMDALHALTAGLRALQPSDEDRVRALLPEGWGLSVKLSDMWGAVAYADNPTSVGSVNIYHPDRATSLRLLAAALREMGR